MSFDNHRSCSTSNLCFSSCSKAPKPLKTTNSRQIDIEHHDHHRSLDWARLLLRYVLARCYVQTSKQQLGAAMVRRKSYILNLGYQTRRGTAMQAFPLVVTYLDQWRASRAHQLRSASRLEGSLLLGCFVRLPSPALPPPIAS